MAEIKTDKNVDFSADNMAYAPKKLITQLRGQFRSWAFEDGIAPKDLNKYILNNINIELDALGYRAIGKL
jgi:hypothetical protein